MAREYWEISRRLPESFTKGGRRVDALVQTLLKDGGLPESLGEVIQMPEYLNGLSPQDLELMLGRIQKELAVRGRIDQKEIRITSKSEAVNRSSEMVFIDKTEGTEQNWFAQVDDLVMLGFHRGLRITEEEYRASIPAFRPQPEHFKGRFDLMLLVDPRIPLIAQLRLHKISCSDYEYFRDQVPDVMTDKPYQLWAHGGERFPAMAPESVSALFSLDERGLTMMEGVALIRERPDILFHHPIDFLGSVRTIKTIVGYTDRTPRAFCKANESLGAVINSYPVDSTPKKSRAASCGILTN